MNAFAEFIATLLVRLLDWAVDRGLFQSAVEQSRMPEDLRARLIARVHRSRVDGVPAETNGVCATRDAGTAAGDSEGGESLGPRFRGDVAGGDNEPS